MTDQAKPIPKIQQVISVLWPSFLTAGVATTLFFVVFDPQLIVAVSGYGEISRLGGYTIGFFLFWMLTSMSCALTCYFRKPTDDIDKK
ncbi:MAG: hypothetical protein OEY52_04395 [Gammaproteobacteria bacterium]|nr:hypothetical protein [Gammaproteobacteria bacterium]